MSFDVYLQDFADEPADRASSVREGVLAPLLDAAGQNIITSDGSAAVYFETEGPLRSVMFNHIDGDAAWDVIYEVPVAGEWAIIPVGCPVCVVTDRMIDTVPAELRADGVVRVRSGAEVRGGVTGFAG